MTAIRILALTTGMAALLLSADAGAQDISYPNRPILVKGSGMTVQ